MSFIETIYNILKTINEAIEENHKKQLESERIQKEFHRNLNKLQFSMIKISGCIIILVIFSFILYIKNIFNKT